MNGKELAKSARRLAEATREAIAWIGDQANADRIGSERRALDRDFRRRAVEALRLAEAAERLMCVAVFGPSQVGKSHLVSVLAAPRGKDLMAVFDNEKTVSYIGEINPDKGKEATGLVTRFSVSLVDTPKGFPVALRLLSHADLIKILCNAYVKDANPSRYEADEIPGPKEIADHIARFEGKSTSARNGITIEDIWDIQDYFTNELSGFSLVQLLSGFWDAAGRLIRALDPPELAEFFSILWGRHERITALYLSLVEALRTLDFALDVFCPLISITQDVRILDVDALSDVTNPSADKLEVATSSGVRAKLTRPIIADASAALAWPSARRR